MMDLLGLGDCPERSRRMTLWLGLGSALWISLQKNYLAPALTRPCWGSLRRFRIGKTGVPPPPRSLGIIDLGAKRNLISGAQSLAGKILRSKELGPVQVPRDLRLRLDYDGLVWLGAQGQMSQCMCGFRPGGGRFRPVQRAALEGDEGEHKGRSARRSMQVPQRLKPFPETLNAALEALLHPNPDSFGLHPDSLGPNRTLGTTGSRAFPDLVGAVAAGLSRSQGPGSGLAARFGGG
jgi:hypothetical protein